MRLPPTVHVVLRRSPSLAAAIGLLTLATLALLFSLPLASWQQAGLLVALGGWMWFQFRQHVMRVGIHAVSELRLAPDLILVACMADGRLVAGHVRSSTYVGAWLTSIVWRADGAWFSRSVLIVPDMLPAEDFRRLRVMLRYARSAVEQGVPPSQA